MPLLQLNIGINNFLFVLQLLKLPLSRYSPLATTIPGAAAPAVTAQATADYLTTMLQMSQMNALAGKQFILWFLVFAHALAFLYGYYHLCAYHGYTSFLT